MDEMNVVYPSIYELMYDLKGNTSSVLFTTL